MSMLRRENKKRHLFALFIRPPPGKDWAHDIAYLSLPRSVGEQYSRVANSCSRVSGTRGARVARHLSAALRTAKRLQEHIR